ncbi:MAG: MATE family efflux transporter [Halanaerobiales bacterium]
MEIGKKGKDEIKEEIVEADSTKKIILKLAWPVIAERSLMTLTKIVDMMMVGRLGAAAITAIGLSFQPLLLVQAFAAAISVGTTALVARFIGAKEEKMGGKVLQQSFLIGSVLAVLILSVYYIFAENIITLMGAETKVIELGTLYLKVMAPGLYFMFMSFMIFAALRGAGDTQTPMKINILINALNVIGNYTLIFGKFGAPELGFMGAAIATSGARAIGGMLVISHVFREKSVVKIHTRNFFKVNLSLVKRVLKVGLPAAMEQFVMRVAQIFYARLVAGLGTLSFAAHQVAINTESLSYMPGFGMAVAATTLVGQNLGAKQPEQAEESAYESWKIGAYIMGFMAVIFLVFPEYLVRLYTEDPEIIRLGARNLRIISLAQIPMGTQFIFAGALRGAGDTKSVFYSTAISSWVGRLGMAYIFINVFEWGLVGAWMAMVIDWTMRGSYVFHRFKKGGWKKLKI